MARIHLTPDLGHAVMFEDVSLATSRTRRRSGSGRRHQLRRLAGESSRQQIPLFEQLSVTVDDGEQVAIIGRKASDGGVEFLRLAAGTLIPDAGRVRRRVPIVPIIDNSNMLNANMTVRQNIYQVAAFLGVAPDDLGSRLDWIVDFGGMGKRLDAYLKDAPKNLRQRIIWTVSFATEASCFAVENALVIGDEEFEARCWEHVDQLKRSGVTFLVVDDKHQRLERFCTRALLLDQGRLVADTTVGEALTRLRMAPTPD